MAKTLEQLLEASGLTAEEMDAVKPMLSNAKFRQSLEGELRQIDTLNETIEADKKWYNEQAVPAVKNAQKDAADARAAQAAAEARLKQAQKYGLEHVAGEEEKPNVEVKPAAGAAVDTSKFVSQDQLLEMAGKETDGMALLADLSDSHHELFGNRLNRRELINKWKANGRGTSLEQFWEQTYNVPAKRKEMSDAAAAKHDADIRADERRKVMSEGGNPMTRPAVNSLNPFTKARDANTKQPWEMTDAEKRAARVSKVVEKQIAQFVQ